MGGGKSSGSSAPVVTKEQKELLSAQTDFLKGTAFPTYKKTIKEAENVYGNVSPVAEKAANAAMTMAEDTAATQKTAGTSGINTGMAGLKALFDPKYEQEQVDAALQAGKETGRELLGEQNAMYGASGGLGGARMALADKNLQSLNNQRQATAAASARAGVQANKAAAANQLATLGGQQLGAANTAAGARISYAQTPQDVLSKYASIIYGTPQGSTTPNFAGTQGTNATSKSGGFNLSDMNAKQDIQQIGVLANGINLYKYQYKPEYRDQWGHGMQIGVLAQEVEKIMPEAVALQDNGLKAVNYSMVLH